MSLIITNYELFEELFLFIKQENIQIEDVLKEFGGSNYYIPSYKGFGRNQEIYQNYKERQDRGETHIAKSLAREYNLSEAQIYAIIKQAKD